MDKVNPQTKDQVATHSGVCFLHAGNHGNWLTVTSEEVKDSSEEEDKRSRDSEEDAREQLSEYLRSVLTTQNLVVLAGSGTSLGMAGGPSMADLWKRVSSLPGFDEVALAVKQPNNDQWIENLLSRCRMAMQFFDEPTATKIAEFLQAAEKMIWKACTEFLDPAKLEGHHTFLRRMARRRLQVPRLKLFTTNYDLCFETAASELGVVVIDGFSFSHPRRFDPRFFSYDIVRRATDRDETHSFVEGVIHVLKLHGSVNWDDTEMGIIQTNEPTKPCLIYPANTKYEQSYSEPHLELMSQFQRALREPNTCLVVIGFGFNDDHLTRPVLSAMKSNPSFKLLVVDRSAKRKSEQNTGVLSLLRKKILAGEADIALLNAEFSQFAELIPQLRALSPAEQIELSVEQIAREA